MNYTLKAFNTGQVTLPKKWRTAYDTNIYLAEETKEGLLISPILKRRTNTDYINEKDIEFFEDEKGISLKFKKGIEASKLLKIIKKYV